MHYRSFLLILLALTTFLITTLKLNAQDNESDSLVLVIKNSKVDSIKVDALNELSYQQFSTNPDTAIYYGEEAKKLAAKIEYKNGLAYANKNIGLGHYMLGDYFKVLTYWEESLAAFQKAGDKVGESNLFLNIGAVYFNFGDDAVALEYYLKSLKAAEEVKDPFRYYSALVNIGTLYQNKEETHDQALVYYLKAIEYLPVIEDKKSIGNLYTNLGLLYSKKKQYDSAITYINKTLDIFKDSNLYSQSLFSLGWTLVEKGDVDEGISIIEEAIQLAEKAGQKYVLSESLIKLGKSKIIKGQYLEAIKKIKEGQKIAEELELNEQIKDSYQYLSQAHEGLNNYKEAFYYKDMYSLMKDTIYSIETNDKLKGLQFTYEIEKKQDEINLLEASNEIQLLETKRQRAISWGAGITGVLILILALGIYRRYKFVNKVKAILETEKDRSDNLLLNILPQETAEELKEKGFTEPKFYDSATILFTDFKGFTSISAAMTPNELVSELHECFMSFDNIISKYGLEKIKTIGDAYMAAGGLPKVNQTHPTNVALAALEIRAYMNQHKQEKESKGKAFFEVRIGINTGPVVAGVVGIKKFAYDIWGDTVNIAARMESSSEAGKVNISEHTYQLIKDKFNCEYRGEIEAKNTGKLKMYFLNDALDRKLEPLKEKNTLLSNEINI